MINKMKNKYKKMIIMNNMLNKNNINNNMNNSMNFNMNNNMNKNMNFNMNNNMNSNNNKNINNERPQEKIPRVEQFIKFNDYESMNEWERINIHFFASSGLKLMLTVPKNMPTNEVLRLYTKKIGISPNLIGKENGIIFLFNATTLLITEKNPIINIVPNLGTVTVVDSNNVIGATNN